MEAALSFSISFPNRRHMRKGSLFRLRLPSPFSITCLIRKQIRKWRPFQIEAAALSFSIRSPIRKQLQKKKQPFQMEAAFSFSIRNSIRKHMRKGSLFRLRLPSFLFVSSRRLIRTQLRKKLSFQIEVALFCCPLVFYFRNQIRKKQPFQIEVALSFFHYLF